MVRVMVKVILIASGIKVLKMAVGSPFYITDKSALTTHQAL